MTAAISRNQAITPYTIARDKTERAEAQHDQVAHVGHLAEIESLVDIDYPGTVEKKDRDGADAERDRAEAHGPTDSSRATHPFACASDVACGMPTTSLIAAMARPKWT